MKKPYHLRVTPEVAAIIEGLAKQRGVSAVNVICDALDVGLQGAQADRISQLAAARKATSTQILLKAIDIGLNSIEAGWYINWERVIVCAEMAAAFADLAAQSVDPAKASQVPHRVFENMEIFHGRLDPPVCNPARVGEEADRDPL